MAWNRLDSRRRRHFGATERCISIKTRFEVPQRTISRANLEVGRLDTSAKSQGQE